MARTRRTLIAISLLAGIASACPAHAAKPVGDYFSAGSQPNKVGSAPSNFNTQGSFQDASSMKDQAVKWFEKFDETIYEYKLTDAEHVILSRSFKQEAERVQEWTRVAIKVAKRYRALVMLLKAMPVPGTLSDLKEYRNLTADWYSDAADIYEDLTKPRPPAKTMEELDDLLNDIKSRAETLSQQYKNLKSLDMTTRGKYRVHQARQDDPLSKYVRSKP